MRIIKYGTILTADTRQIMLVKQNSVNYPEKEFRTPEKVRDMLCNVFQLDLQTEEYVYLLCFNTKQRLQGVFELSHGAVNYSIYNPREIFQKALLCNASSIILAHNHPSGDVTPSMDDYQAYDCVFRAGELIGINVIDNLIIATDGYYSFSEQNLREGSR